MKHGLHNGTTVELVKWCRACKDYHPVKEFSAHRSVCKKQRASAEKIRRARA